MKYISLSLLTLLSTVVAHAFADRHPETVLLTQEPEVELIAPHKTGLTEVAVTERYPAVEGGIRRPGRRFGY